MSEPVYFMQLYTDQLTDAEQMGNVARYINHSCEGNCRTNKYERGEVEMSARTGKSQMPVPVPVPAGTGQPERRGCMYRPGQGGPSRYTGTGSGHLPKFEVPVDLQTRQNGP